MTRTTWLVIAGLVVAAGGLWYYRKRSAEIQQASLNPNEAIDPQLGALASGYERMTGQTGNTYTSNERYAEYLQYLHQGGLNSGQTFEQYLTASQGQSLPTNS